MKITLKYDNTDYTIDADGSCFMPVKHGINKVMKDGVKGANYGKPTETILGYYKSLGDAVIGIINQHEGSKDESLTLRGYVDRIEAAKEEIKNQLDVLAI